MRTAANVLRDRNEDILTPAELATRHSAYRHGAHACRVQAPHREGDDPRQFTIRNIAPLPQVLFPDESASISMTVRAPASALGRVSLVVSGVIDGPPGSWVDETSFTLPVEIG